MLVQSLLARQEVHHAQMQLAELVARGHRERLEQPNTLHHSRIAHSVMNDEGHFHGTIVRFPRCLDDALRARPCGPGAS